MKMHTGRRFFGLLAGFCLAAGSASADLEVSASVQIHAKADFEAPLATHGTWVEVGSYGRCWRPAHVAVEWRPYCSGEWVWTDCGWYWASEEPWGWACYHYGAWVYDSSHGWVWVPGVEWAPAWVSWRVGGGYIGWAPLPPPGWFFARRPGPDVFVFVSAGHIAGPIRPSTVIVKNTTIISKTSEVGGMKRETRTFAGSGSQRVMVNQGPSVEMVQKATGKTFGAVPIREAARKTGGPAPVQQHRTVETKAKPESRDTRDQVKSRPDPADRGGDKGKDRMSPAPDRSAGPGFDFGSRGDRGSFRGGGGGGGGRGRGGR